MTSVYPGSYDALSNPTSSDSLAAVPHATQHANINDAMEAVQAELGLDPAGASATVKARLDVVETAGWVTSTRILDGTVALADLTTGLQNQLQGGTVLVPDALTPAPGEQLLKQAVWWIDAAHSGSTGAAATNLGWGGTALNAAQATVGNQPVKLDYAGTPYVYLPGVASNYLSVPDEAALDVVGDIDIRVRVALDDWTPAAQSTLVAKYEAGALFLAYLLDVNATGTLRFVSSTDGSAANVTASSTVATGITDGATKWVRATRNATTGDVKFYLSDDNVTYTQLGATVAAATGAIYASGRPLAIGARADGSVNPSAGKFYRAIVKNGIDGTTVLDIDTSVIGTGAATSFTALTGQTVTVNRSTAGRKAVCVVAPCWLFGTDDYLEVPDSDLLDFGATDSFTVVAAVRQWATVTAQGLVAKEAGLAVANVGYALYSDVTLHRFIMQDGSFQPFANQNLTYGALQSVAGVRNTTTDTMGLSISGAALTTGNDTTTGTLVNAQTLRIGSIGGANLGNFEGVAFAVFRRALTATEITVISDYMKGRG